jgi:voltage-gated potassium channel
VNEHAAQQPVDHAGPRLMAFERRVEWPLAFLAGTFLVVYSVDVLAEGLSPGYHRALQIVDYGIWALFAADYISRIGLAADRFGYWWRHLPDLAIIALPVLRPLRLMRLVMLFRVLNRPMIDKLHGKVAVYGLTGAVLLVYCAALAELDAERHHAASNIKNFSDALWWAVVTICTVGYGDRYPVTGEGRLIGAGLMVGGVALLAAVTASFATWLIDRLRVEQTDAEASVHTDVSLLQAQLDRIEAQAARETAALRDQLARIETALGHQRGPLQAVDLPDSASS